MFQTNTYAGLQQQAAAALNGYNDLGANGYAAPPKTPAAQAQMEVLHKTVADLVCAIDTLEGRLGSVLPPQGTTDPRPVGNSGIGGGSPIYCQLLSLTDTANGLAARVRYIADRIEV